MKKDMRFGQRLDVEGRSEDVCMVLDLSGSMAFEDLRPCRLEASKKATEAHLALKREQHPTDRVGVVGFNWKSWVVHDLEPVRDAYETLTSSVYGLKACTSTNITAGLKRAETVLSDQERAPSPSLLSRLESWIDGDSGFDLETNREERTRRIILLGDGAHNGFFSPLPIAGRLKESGVVIDCIGIGGSPDADEFDEKLLKKIASENPDGSPRYCLIHDTERLIRKFEALGQHIRPMS